jgi:hypothetical protein
VDASSSPDQVTWTTPVTLGQGVEPKVVLTSDGHAIAVWQAQNGATSLGIQAKRPHARRNLVILRRHPDLDPASRRTLVRPGHPQHEHERHTRHRGRPRRHCPDRMGPSDGNVQASTSSITGPWTSPATISLDRYHMRGLKVTLNDGILPTVTLSNSTWSTP